MIVDVSEFIIWEVKVAGSLNIQGKGDVIVHVIVLLMELLLGGGQSLLC